MDNLNQNPAIEDAVVEENDVNGEPELKDEELMNEATKALEENEKLNEELKTLKEENESLKAKVAELEAKNQELSAEIEKLNNEKLEQKENKEVSSEQIVEGVLKSEVFKKAVEEIVKGIYDPIINEIKDIYSKKEEKENQVTTTESIEKVQSPVNQFITESKDDTSKFKSKQEFEKELLELARQLVSEI